MIKITAIGRKLEKIVANNITEMKSSFTSEKSTFCVKQSVTVDFRQKVDQKVSSRLFLNLSIPTSFTLSPVLTYYPTCKSKIICLT